MGRSGRGGRGVGLASELKKKNNHFVPRSYLRHFQSRSDREIGLYNMKSDRVVERAPIKSQCSRDYFYTRNPEIEDAFGDIEGIHEKLLNNIVASQAIPSPESPERNSLYSGIMFQAGRTAATVANMDHIAEQFSKAILRKQLERDGNRELLGYLPKVKMVTTTAALIGSIINHVASRPLIDDLECTLILNSTSEDFLTSDHPVALCNSLPSTYVRRNGFACRGLIILYPIGPRALLFLSDPEAYKVDKNSSGTCTLRCQGDIIRINLAQCANAYENLYFASAKRVEATLDAYRKNPLAVRPDRATLKETPVESEDRSGILLDLPRDVSRLPLPAVVQIRRAVKTGKFKVGNALIRDPKRAAIARAMADRMTKGREEMGEK